MRDRLWIIFLKNKTLISNFSYLSILQVLSLLIPLIIYPFLIARIGSHKFGLIVFAQAIIGYFTIFVGFGFNIAGVNEISINRNNREKLIQIFNSILAIKCTIFLASIIVFFGLTFVIPQLYDNMLLFLLTFWFALLDIVFPIWYFQGIEKMKYITYLSLGSKLIFLILIVLFINSEADYIRVPVFQGVGVLFIGFCSFYIIVIKHEIRITIPKKKEISRQLKVSFPIFISNISVQLYANSNRVLIGYFLGMNEVTYYDLSEKIINLIRLPQSIITQTIFPKISIEKNIAFVKKIAKFSIVLIVLISILTYYFSNELLVLLGGDDLVNANTALHLLLITAPVVVLSNIFGVQVIIPFGYTKVFTKIIVASFIFYLIVSLFIYYIFGFNLEKIIYSTILTELFVTVTMYLYCKKLKLW